MRHAVFAMLALLGCSQGVLRAQEFRAFIDAQVTDPSGAPIPGAAVVAVSVATRQTYTGTSDSAGQCTLPYLLPGKYTVTVTAPHFQKALYSNVELASAQKLSLNVALALGSVDQQVTVTQTPGLLDTETANVGGVVDQARIENLPSTGRQVWEDLAFSQGVRLMSTDPFDTTPRNNTADTYSADGSPTNANAYYLNGAPVSDSGTWYFVPNQDAIQELQGGVSYDAQYGRAAGGSFNSNVKAGANGYHGALWDYYGNEALNANSYQANLNGIPKSLNIRNTFGGVFGGPVRKDKTFFFGSYEGFRQNFPTPAIDSVPPVAWRTGNFANSPYTIFDPLTSTCTKTNATGQCSTYGRTQFPGNVIPSSRINPIGAAIINLYPLPTNPGNASNYAVAGARDFLYDQYIGRVDHNFSSNTRFYGMYTFQRNLAHNPGNGLVGVASTGTVPSGIDYNVVLDLTHVISSAMVLDVKLSVGRYTSSTLTGNALSQNFTGSQIGGLNMPLVPSTTHLNVVPQIAITNFTTLFGNTDSGTVDNDFDFSSSLVHVIGKHTLHYGFEFLDVQSGSSGIPGNPNGTFTFNAGWTQGNPQTATNGQGVGIASLLLGDPASGSLSWNSNQFVTYHYYGLYLQDDYKLRKNITLNVGLRWDINTSPSERFDRINAGFCYSCKNPITSQINYAQFPNLQNPLMGGLLFAGVGGVPSAPFQVQAHDWQPRLGISWAISPKTVFRAGYGLYDSSGRNGTDSLGFNQTTSYTSSLDGNLTPVNYFASGKPYPNGILSPSGASLGLATQAGQAVTYNSTDRRIPYSEHWSIGLQRSLPKSVLLEVDYVGSHTHAIGVSTAFDVMNPALQGQCYKDNAVCNTNVANPFYGVLPAAAALGASPTVQAFQLQQPWPLFNGVTESEDPNGESDYHALQVRVERKIASLDFVFNYAYANWMDETSYLNNGTFRDAKLWRGLDSNDRRHTIAFNMVWPLPIGKGRQFVRNASGWLGTIVNDWLFDSAVEWGSGTPLAIPAADFYGPGCGSFVPPGGQTQAHWINNNISCYHNLLPYESRTLPLNVGYLRNPDLFTWNPALQKRFTLPWDKVTAQFRMEAVNGANHPYFGGPSEAIATPPTFTPGVGWVGFGTLPSSQLITARAVIASLKILF